jgi:predicted MFS family arabinose efflux permease
MNNAFLFIVVGGIVVLFIVSLLLWCFGKSDERRRYKAMMRERKVIRNWGIM